MLEEYILIDASLAEQHRVVFSRAKFIELYAQAEASAIERVGLIIKAQGRKDAADIENHAHALAGLSVNFGFTALCEAVTLVKECAVQQDNEQLSTRIQELEKINRATFDKLREIVPSN